VIPSHTDSRPTGSYHRHCESDGFYQSFGQWDRGKLKALEWGGGEQRPAKSSNNDGCIIARSNGARAIGFKIGDPYFKVKAKIAEHGVAVFSSNYTLYGDVSQWVMQTLQQLAPTPLS
jgi:nucleotidyltransferase/DNA polymerase involved in DNA repair